MATLTVTSLLENIFRAKDKVARELTGFIPSVLVNSGTDGVSINGTVTAHYAPEPTLNTSWTPTMTLPEGDAATITVDTMQITEAANIKFSLTGEQLRQIDNTAGQGVIDDYFTQSIRKMVNAIEAHVATVAYKGSSRAVGTAGTTPFGSNHNVVNSLRQILVDNGAPLDSTSLIINSAAGVNLRNLSNLYKVNEAGSGDLLRRGVLTDISGIMIKESAQVQSHTKGAGASYVINNGNIAVGSTTISVDGGTVNTTGFKAGDVISIADEPTSGKYVVKTGLTAVAGDIVLNNPGLRGAIVDGKAVTIGDTYTANVAFNRNAIELVMRPPFSVPGGDAATDRMTIRDDQTGLVFEVALYKGKGMVTFEIVCLYKAKVWKPEFVATLLG